MAILSLTEYPADHAERTGGRLALFGVVLAVLVLLRRVDAHVVEALQEGAQLLLAIGAVVVELIALLVSILLIPTSASRGAVVTAEELHTSLCRNLIHVKESLLVIRIVDGDRQQEHLARHKLAGHQLIQLLYTTFAVGSR